jgi:hypothetical protein
MLYVGLDLSRRRLDFQLDGGLPPSGLVPCDRTSTYCSA